MVSLERKSYYERIHRFLPSGRVLPAHYLVALVAVAVATAIRYFGDRYIGAGFVFILYYPTVMIVAWLGGLGPGLLATLLSAFLGLALFVEPHGLAWPTGRTEVQITIFGFSGVLISGLMDIMHRMMTEQRRLNDELFRQKENFRVTLSSIGDAVMVTDRNGILTFTNAEADRLTGWDPAEARGKPLRSVFRIVNEETRHTVDDPVEKVFKEKRVVGLANHTLLLSRNGTEHPIDDSAAPIYDREGQIEGVVLVFHDVAEARRAQRALKTHADELEHKVFERTLSLQRTITELESFSYTVSHDLRSPLRAMIGYSTALMEDFASALPEQASDYLQRIARAAQRLDRLIQDLLTYSRVTTEETAIDTVDFDRLVRDVVQQYPDLQHHASKIAIQGRLPKVLGHESALIQVVANLLGNALKFVPAGREPRVTVYAETDEHVARLWFVDNGIGISPENHHRIFKMFEQINPPQAYAGTGIGLAVVKKAVERMQGTLGVESVEGEGSRFWIELLRDKKA